MSMDKMKQLYLNTSLKCSQLITNEYSTSFTLGIKTLHYSFHTPIYAIYGFVRFADEIVDTFHNQDKGGLLEQFRNDTFHAIENGFSANPVLHSFQWVVHQYQIDRKLIEAFLNSMEMDLTHNTLTQEAYETYIWGSAEVVGLMCLKVFVNDDQDQYERLKDHAISLGSAFQKVNFLRDLRSDYVERGRIYFPNVDYSSFDEQDKKAIETDIQQDFDHAYEGIRQLDPGVKFGVMLAYNYYQKLFNKIQQASPSKLQSKRLRIPDLHKFRIMAVIYLKTKFNLI